MAPSTFTYSVGAVFVALGVFGFIPGFRSVLSADTLGRLSFDGGYGLLFGVFAVNWVESFVHLGVGIAAWYSGGSEPSAREFSRGLAWFYGALAVMGLFPHFNMGFGLLPLYGHEVWLHAGSATLAGYVGFRKDKIGVQAVVPYGEAA
jgi:hypothetical protein